MNHYVLPPFSEEWLLWNIGTLCFIISLIYIGRKLNLLNQKKMIRGFIVVMVLEYIGIQSYYIYHDLWTVQDSLPFHLCRLMWFNALFVIITRNQLGFEMLLFIGMVGGFHSLLTPELTHGKSLYLMFDYFLVHGGLVAIPLYCVWVLGMRPRRFSWIKSFLYFQILVLIVAVLDFVLGANYMYLAEKPNVNNPLLIGPWPYYILGLQLATLLHTLIIYLPFYFKKSFLLNE